MRFHLHHSSRQRPHRPCAGRRPAGRARCRGPGRSFKNTMPGTSATLVIKWRYADDTTSESTPITVRRGDEPKSFTRISQRNDAIQAIVKLKDDDGVVRVQRSMLFGDQ